MKKVIFAVGIAIVLTSAIGAAFAHDNNKKAVETDTCSCRDCKCDVCACNE